MDQKSDLTRLTDRLAAADVTLEHFAASIRVDVDAIILALETDRRRRDPDAQRVSKICAVALFNLYFRSVPFDRDRAA